MDAKHSRNANLTAENVTIKLRPLKNQNQAFGSSDEVLLTGTPYGTPKSDSEKYDTW